MTIPHNAANSVSPRGFATIKNLTEGGRNDIAGTFKVLGSLLADSGLRGTLQVWLVPDDTSKASCFALAFGEARPALSTTPVNNPTVELVMRPEVWNDIANGKLAPIDAFMNGVMRLRGDVTVAQKLMKHTAGSKGRTHFCLGGE